MEKFPQDFLWVSLSVSEKMVVCFGVWASFFCGPPFFSLGAVAPSPLLGRFSGVWGVVVLFRCVVRCLDGSFDSFFGPVFSAVGVACAWAPSGLGLSSFVVEVVRVGATGLEVVAVDGVVLAG